MTSQSERPASRWLLLGLLLVTGILAFFYLRPLFHRPPVVDVFRVKSENVARVLVASGRVKASETVLVQAKITGQIRELLFDEGQRVRAGDVLARLDDRALQAVSAQVQAQLSARQADVAQLVRDLERSEQLKSRGIIASVQFDKLKTELKRGQDDVERLQAAQREAQARLDDTVVRAPLDAIILSRPVDAGQVVDNKTLIFELASTDAPEVETEVDELYAAELKAGLKVKFAPLGSAQTLYDGVVNYVSPKIDSRTGGRVLRAKFERLPDGLLPGQSVDVNILVAQHQAALTIPRSAIVDPRGQPFVWLSNPAGGLKKAPIKFLDWPASRLVVTQGLEADQSMVRQASQVGSLTRIRPLDRTEEIDALQDAGAGAIFAPPQ
jgi:RND family efflux transporter MFP subunit